MGGHSILSKRAIDILVARAYAPNADSLSKADREFGQPHHGHDYEHDDYPEHDPATYIVEEYSPPVKGADADYRKWWRGLKKMQGDE